MMTDKEWEAQRAEEAAWKALTARKDIPPDMFNTLRQTFAARAALLTVREGAKIEELTQAVKAELANYSPKSRREGRRKKAK